VDDPKSVSIASRHDGCYCLMTQQITYQIVWQAGEQGYTTWSVSLLPAGAALGAALLLWLTRRLPRAEVQIFRAVLQLLILFGSLAALWLLIGTRREFVELRQKLRNGDFRLVTGIVSDFVPEGPGGHPQERFRIGNQEFVYSSSDITSAYHLTAPHGGHIREGLTVRIAEADGHILRLEIAEGRSESVR
jgi:hypothetical protein